MSGSTDKAVSDLDRLHEFCRRNQKELVQDLLTKDKKLLNTKASLGFTALHWASSTGSTEIVAYLLSQGANLNDTNTNLDTALHLATWKDHPDTVKLLLQQKGIDKNIKNKDGKDAYELIRSDEVRAIFPAMDANEVKNLIVARKEEEDDDDDDEDW